MNVSHAMIAVLSFGAAVCVTDTVREHQDAARHAEALRLIAICADKGQEVRVGRDLQPVCAAPVIFSRRAM
jgi:hypothetical protein